MRITRGDTTKRIGFAWPGRQSPRRNRKRREYPIGQGTWQWNKGWPRLRMAALGLVVLTVLGGAGLGMVHAWRVVRASPRLAVHAIDVEGTERAMRNEILAHAQIKVGIPIFDVDLDRIAMDVRRHPWVDRVTVRRRLPDRVVIHITEHQPAIYVSMGELFLASPEGRLFRKFTATDGIVLPILTGITANDVQRDAPGAEAHIRDGVGLFHALQQEEALWGSVNEVHWDRALGWSVINDKAVRLHMGHAPLTRIALGTRTLQHLHASARVPATIWIDGEKNPDRVHVKLAVTP